MVDLKIGLDKIKKVYHISDVHIRNFKRHKEYREVFQTIKEYIKKTKTPESIICLTGDIVHSKTDITPELVQEVTYLFNILSEELPIILIPGNHDTNLNNNNRLDSLSPIVDALKNPKIYYLKDSGVYKCANLELIHWSVFDKPENFPKPENLKGCTKIGLYHGAVKPFDFSGGFEYSNSSLKSEDFAEFDITMLGDLHKAHYVDERKTAGYPGSTIQQNHGEDLNHGILVWDIDSKSAEFVNVPNNTAYYTVDIEEGLYNPIPSTIPNRIYLRVRYKNTDYSVVKRIISEIKSEREVVEVTEQKINTFEKGNYKENRRVMPDVRNISEQNIMLREYLTDKFNLTLEEVEKVCDLNTVINSEVKVVDSNRNINWSPRRFEFSNMFSYGENNVIDFQTMTGTYGIFAPNASGKSSFLSALEYCIFDKCSKTSKASHVMNNKASTFHCKLEFELNGHIHVIERRAKKSKSDTVKVDVDFYYYDSEGTIVSLNGKERSDTNGIIRNLLGSYEDFILTCMSIQGNNTGFIDMGQADRKNLLVQFLDIEIFDYLYDIANAKVKELSVLVKEYKKIDYDVQIQTLSESKKSDSERLNKLLEDKESIEHIIETLSQKLNELKIGIVEVEVEYGDVESLENKKQGILKTIESNKEKVEYNKKVLDSCNNAIIGIQSKIDAIDQQNLQEQLNKLMFHMEQEKSLTVEVERMKVDMINKMDKMSKLEDLEYDESCPYCMNNVFVKDAIKTKESLKDAEIAAKEKVASLKELRELINTFEEYKNVKIELDSLSKDLLTQQSSKVRVEGSINEIERTITQYTDNVAKVDEAIKKYYANLDAITNNSKIKEKISTVLREANIKKDNLNSINKKISECNSSILYTKTQIEGLEKSITKLKSLEDEYKFYNYYLTAVSKDGVPHTIMTSVIPIIEEDINNILSQIVEFKIEVKSDGKNINAYIVYDDSRVWPIELASGMEKFVSSLAIRTSLINISSLPRPSFLAIDEGFGVLDIENIGNISILMDYLKTQFKFILMISHIDSIKDVVDGHIEVVKNKDGASKIQSI